MAVEADRKADMTRTMTAFKAAEKGSAERTALKARLQLLVAEATGASARIESHDDARPAAPIQTDAQPAATDGGEEYQQPIMSADAAADEHSRLAAPTKSASEPDFGSASQMDWRGAAGPAESTQPADTTAPIDARAAMQMQTAAARVQAATARTSMKEERGHQDHIRQAINAASQEVSFESIRMLPALSPLLITADRSITLAFETDR